MLHAGLCRPAIGPIAILVLLVSTIHPAGSATASFDIVTPDSAGDVGIGAALALHTAPQGPVGGAVAAYLLHRPDTSYDLRWAERWGGVWQSSQVMASVDPVAPTIVTDGSGGTHIVFSSGQGLWHAFRTHFSSWTFESIPAAGYVTGLSAAVDPLGRLHVSFEDAGGLRYALRASNGFWISEQVIAYQVGQMGNLYNLVTTSIATDAAGDPSIAYFCGDTQLHRWPGYAYKTSGAWAFSWPAEAPDLFGMSWVTSLAIDSRDRPHVAYSADLFQVVYVLDNGWINEGSLPQPTGKQVSLVTDSNDRPCVLVERNGQVVFAVRKGTTWVEEVVAPTCNSQWFSLSLAYDAPRIAFYDQCAGDLRFASGRSFNDYMEVPDGPGSVGFGPSIGLSRLVPVGANAPQAQAYEEARISYASYGELGVWFATRQGTGVWNIASVDPNGFGFTSLARVGGFTDEWAIAYCGDAGPHQVSLRYAVGSPLGTWSVTDVHTDYGSSDPAFWPVVSLAVGPGDQPHIVYSFGDCATDLLYATREGGQWSIEQIAGCAPATVAVDASGVPHVSYYDWDGSLVYALRSPTGWVSETVGPAMLPYENAAPSIAVDSNGRPAISYYQSQHLYVANRGATGWSTALIDAEAGVGAHSSLQFDQQGKKHVAYSRANGVLKYAVEGASGWTIEALIEGGGVGRYASLALNEAGNPRIACLVSDQLDLMYFARPLEPDPVTGVEDAVIPPGFSATGPWPNPAQSDGELQLAVELPTADHLGIALYDLGGRRVAARTDESYPAGRHTVRWRPGTLEAGVYFLRVRAARLGVRTMRVVAVR